MQTRSMLDSRTKYTIGTTLQSQFTDRCKKAKVKTEDFQIDFTKFKIHTDLTRSWLEAILDDGY